MGPSRAVCRQELDTLELWTALLVQGTAKKGELLAWGRRGGMKSCGRGAFPCREEYTQVKPAFLHCGETPTLDSGSPLLPSETARQGPTLRASVGQPS